jgi:hypothetical protein
MPDTMLKWPYTSAIVTRSNVRTAGTGNRAASYR